VKTPALAMQQVYTLSSALYRETSAAAAALDKARTANNDAAVTALTAAVSQLDAVLNSLQAADVPPTTLQLKAIAGARSNASAAMAKYGVSR
jgi:hypothetical protein